MRMILASFGSYGDIRPFLWMGRALRKAGHEVVFTANPFFEDLIKGESFDFRPAGTVEEYRLAATPAAATGSRFRDQGEQIAASRRLFENMFMKPTRATYEIITECKTPDTVVLGHFYAYGAKLAAEKHGLPHVNICLSPYWLKAFQKPAGIQAAMQKLGACATARFIDGQLFAKPMGALRAKSGLPPLTMSSSRWMFGGENLCLFPGWLPDFALEAGMRAEFAGFPLEEAGSLPGEAEAFLVRNPTPIVFTPGSAVTDAGAFFREALAALRELGRPGIFLSRSKSCMPADLPENVLYAGYLPLESLLGRCGAIVHHGGIGTAAQALCCGTPQLICPRMDEQRENARLLARLGVCEALPHGAIGGGRLAISLKKLTESAGIREKCLEIRQKRPGMPEERLKAYIAKCGRIQAK